MTLLERGDSEGLFRYVSEEEKAALELDQAKLREFLERFYATEASAFHQVGSDEIDTYQGSGSLSLTRTYRSADGREMSVYLTVTSSQDGPKLFPLTPSILFAGLQARWPREPNLRPPAVSGQAAFAAALERSVDTLNSLALKGSAVVIDGNVQLRSWNETYRRFKARAEQLATRE